MGLFDFMRRRKAADASAEDSTQPIGGRRVIPQPGEYFKARGAWVTVYGQCIRSGEDRISARCYSEMCPMGESGGVATSSIISVISQEEFEKVKQNDWV